MSRIQNLLDQEFEKRAGDKCTATFDRMLEAGANIVDVAKILGHSSLKMTMRYAHPEDSLKSAVEGLTPDRHNKNHNKLSDGRKKSNDQRARRTIANK